MNPKSSSSTNNSVPIPEDLNKLLSVPFWPLGGPAFSRLCRALPNPKPSFLYQLDQIDLANKYYHSSNVERSKNNVDSWLTIEINHRARKSSIPSLISPSVLSPDLKDTFARSSSIETARSRSIFTDKHSHFSQSSPISSTHEVPSPTYAREASQHPNLDGAPILDHEDIIQSEQMKEDNNLYKKRPHLLDDGSTLSNKKNKIHADEILHDHSRPGITQVVQQPGNHKTEDPHLQVGEVESFLDRCILPAVTPPVSSFRKTHPASLPQPALQQSEHPFGSKSTYSDPRRSSMVWDNKIKGHFPSQKSDLRRSELTQHSLPHARITPQRHQSFSHKKHHEAENWSQNHDSRNSGSKVSPRDTLTSHVPTERLTLGSASNNVPMPFVRSFASKPQSETLVPEEVLPKEKPEFCIPELLNAIKSVKSSRLRSDGYVGDEAMVISKKSHTDRPSDLRKTEMNKNPLGPSNTSNVDTNSNIDGDERGSRRAPLKLEDTFPLDPYILNVIENNTTVYDRWVLEAFCRVGMWLEEEKKIWEHGNWGTLLSNQLARFIDIGGKDRLSRLLAAHRPHKFEEILKIENFSRFFSFCYRDQLMHIRLRKDFTPRGLFYRTLILPMRKYTYDIRTSIIDRNRLEMEYVLSELERPSGLLPPYTTFRKYTRYAETEGVIVMMSRAHSSAKDIKLTPAWVSSSYQNEPAPDSIVETNVVEEIESLMAESEP